MKYFFDMDGTLCEFRIDARLDDLYKKGYFLSLKEHPNVVILLKNLIANGEEVYILSAVLGAQQEYEKRQWIREHDIVLPEEHLLFVPCGSNKAERVKVDGTSVLVDDHTPNLLDWKAAGGIGVKVLTGINGLHGRWKGKAFTADTIFGYGEFEDFVMSNSLYVGNADYAFQLSSKL